MKLAAATRRQCDLAYFLTSHPLQVPSPRCSDGSVSICFIALQHYVNMYIAVSGGMSAPMELNGPSKKGNLKASHECPPNPPAPHNICRVVMHTQKWTLTSSCRAVSRPICARGRSWHPGSRWGDIPFIGDGWALSMNAPFVIGLLIMRPHSARADARGRLLSGVPSADVNNKRRSGIIRPPGRLKGLPL